VKYRPPSTSCGTPPFIERSQMFYCAYCEKRTVGPSVYIELDGPYGPRGPRTACKEWDYETPLGDHCALRAS